MSSVFPATAEGQLRRARGELETGLRAGTDPRVETLLAAYPALAADAEAAIELVYTEFVVRQELGQRPTPAEWYARFPQWRADLEQMFQVHDVLCQSDAGRPRPDLRMPPPAAGSSGVTIPGYDILEEVGRGGMGVVYKARHAKLNRVVAVKVILAGELAGEKERERFRREAEAAARLDHPNIVRVYEVGEHADRPYCAMEYVSGGQLAARMTSTPWPVAVAARLVGELARAADHAHRRGVVHRDLKPANILLTHPDPPAADPARDTRVFRPSQPLLDLEADAGARAVPKVVDFGLAKCLSDSNPTLTRVGDVVGTPLYMAPEQAAGRGAVGPAADVWALGVILYELLTGHPPFQGDSAAETLNQVRTAEPVPPRQLRAKLPRDLDTVCLRCLQKEPHRRYPSAATLADDLDRWARGEAITARPVRWPEVLAKWARREPRVAGLAAGIAAVAVLGVAGIVWQWQRAEGRRDEAVSAGRLADAARAEAERVGVLALDAREAAEARLYASQIAQAATDVAAGRTAAAERLLGECKAREPDRCGWEWDYLKRKCRPHLVEMAGHAQPVNSLAYSPDGRRLVSAGGAWNGTAPGEVRVWDADTGALLHDLRGPGATVYRAAFHPGGTEVAAASMDGNVWRWDLRGGVRPLPPLWCGTGVGVYAVAYHPDGQSLAAACGDGSVQVWDAASGRRRDRHVWHTNNVYDLAYSPDGRYFASTCRDGAVVVRAADDYRVLYERRLVSDARRVAFSPDSRLMAAVTFGGEVTVWDLADGCKPLAGHQTGMGNDRTIAFRPDGRHLACATLTADVRVWLVRGENDDPPAGTGAGRATALAYRPDARRLAVARGDNVVRVWDLTAPPEPRTIDWGGAGAWIQAVAVSPDGRTLALAGAKNQAFSGNTTKLIRLLSAADGRAADLSGHEGWPTALAYRPDGRQVASADDAGGVCLWEPAAGARPARLVGHAGAVHALAYHPGGTRLATAGADRTARLWDTASGTERGRLDHPAAVHAVAYSSDGRLLATGGGDRLVRVWDAATLSLKHTLASHQAGVTSVAFRPGSAELVSADEDQELRFWDADAGRNLTVHAPPAAAYPADDRDGPPVPRPPARNETCLAFSPDGRRLALAGTSRPVQVWDADARHPLLELGEPNFIHKQSVAFSPDGRQLVTASRTWVTFWDATVDDPAARRAAADRRAAAWHAERAEADLDIGDWFGAEFHATRVLAADPLRPYWYARRGEARAALGRPAEAAADHDRALAVSSVRVGTPPPLVPGDEFLWVCRGEAHARLGEWADVTRANTVALLHGPRNVTAWYNLASARLAASDEAGYRAACRAMVRQFAATPAVTTTVFAVAPLRAGLDADTWACLAHRAQAFGSVRATAAALYRAGRDRQALRAFEAIQWQDPPRAWDMLFRAMAHRRLGDPAGAAAWLARARVWVVEADRIAATPTAWGNARWFHWNERAEVRALLREAEELIPEPPDPAVRDRCLAVLRGGLKSDEFWPAMHAAEALTLAGHGREVLAALAERTEADDQRRCGLAREAVRAGDRTRLPALLAILDEPGSNGHSHAAESLFKVAEVGDGRKLRAALAQDADPRPKLMAAAALARGGHPTALDAVRKRLTDPDVELRKVAVWVLGQLGDKSDAGPIRAGLAKETDPLARAYIANALAMLGDADGRKELGRNLASADPAVKTYAAEFAGHCRAAEFREALVKLLDDPTLDVRVRAAQSLLALERPTADAAEVIVADVYPATDKNPRYSEGSVAVLADGTLLYATTEFTGGAADESKARIVARASRDGGRTWSEPRALQENVGKQNVMSATLRRLKPGAADGPLGLFYLVKNGPADLKVYLRVSTDEAKTFGRPVCVTDAPGYHVLNNDRVTVLSTGRIVVPVAWAADIRAPAGGHFVSLCYFSDDGGATWTKGAGSIDQPKRGAMEPEVVELTDGKLLMIVRTQLGHIATATSADGGDHWGEPSRLSVSAPESPATIRRIPATGDLLLVWNNTHQPGAGHGGQRTPLTAAVSSDEGKTWQHVHNLEDRANQTYAYTSILFVKDRVLLTYYVAGQEPGRWSSRFRSLPVRWLYAGPR